MNKTWMSLLLSVALASATHAQETPAPATPPPVATTPQQVEPAKATAKAPAKGAARADRLDLETTVVTGNRELPKVLYIVPWKKADLGELPAQPFNTLLDGVLQPVNREVFKREVQYFQAVSSGVGSGAAAVKSDSLPPASSPQ